MVRERYKPEDNKFISYSEVDTAAVAELIYDEVGARFQITWSDGEPVVDSDNLPDGVSMNDVKNAIKNNHPRA